MQYRLVEENLRVAMRCYAMATPEGDAREYPGLAVTSSGLRYPVFNSALLSAAASDREFRRLLALAKTHFDQRGTGWIFWLCDNLVPNGTRSRADRLFAQLGMPCIALPPGMYCDRIAPPVDRRGLEIRPIADRTAMLDFAQLSTSVFSLPRDTARAIYGHPGIWRDPMRGWVGYLANEPVTVATVVIGAGVAGVYSVGTLPACQRRGYAEVMIRHALDEVRRTHGIEATVLQSTREGLHLYERLGYKPVTRFSVYICEGHARS